MTKEVTQHHLESIQNLQMSPVPQKNNWQRTSFGSTENTYTGSSFMILPFSLQLPSVITISLTYERKNIYRTFFATTNFQLQIMYSTGAKETVGRVGLNIQFMANLVAVLLGLPFYFLPTQISNTSLTTALYYKSGFKNIIFGFVSYYMYYA